MAFLVQFHSMRGDLSTEMGPLQERITTTRKGSITSVQAIYVPADDLADPAPAGGEGVARGHDR